MIFYFSLPVLFFVFLIQITNPSFLKKQLRRLFIFIVSFLFLFQSYSALVFFLTLKNNKFTKLFLPPYTDYGYFIQHSFFRFFAPFIISLLFALLAIIFIRKLNHRFKGRFFYREEEYLAGLSLFLSGYPIVIFSILFVFISNLLTSLFFQLLILNKKLSTRLPSRVSFYYLWVPATLFAIIISSWLRTETFWKIIQLNSYL